MRLAALASAVVLATATAAPAWAQTAAASRPDAQTEARYLFAVLTGEIAANTGHPNVAYTELLKAARDLENPALFRRAAEIALRAGQPDKALAAAQAWRRALPDSPEARSWVVQLQLATGHQKEAAESIAQDLARTPEPQRGQAIASLLPLALRADDPAAALALMQKALAGQQQFAQTHVVIGLLRQRLGDNAAAMAEAQQALKIDPTLVQGAALMVQSYAADPIAADAALRAFFAAQPGDSELRLAWAQAALQAQRDGVALQQLQQVVKTLPHSARAWLLLGNLQTEFGEPAKAIESLQQYLKVARGEDNPRLLTAGYLALAEAARKLGDVAQANRWLDQVKADGDTRVALATSRAQLLVQQGQVDAAMHLVGNLPGNTPEQRKTRLFARAQVLREAKLYEPAFQVLQSAVKQFPDDPDVLYEAAMMADKAGHFGIMEQWLRKVIRLDPQFQPGYNALGYTMVERGQSLPEARKLIERALQLAPGNPFVLDSLGWLDYKQGRLPQAEKHLREAYDARPDPEIAAHLGEALWALGQPEQARKIWLDAQRRAPDNAALKAVMQKYGVQH